MKNLLKLIVMVVLTTVGAINVHAQTDVTVTVDKSNGRFTAGNASGSWNSVWTSNDNMLNFSASANNMCWASSDANHIDARCGSSGSSTYTLAPVEADDYVITGYSLKLHSLGSKAQVWTINGTSYTTSSTGDVKTISVTGLNERSVAFTESQNNDTGTLLYDFTVTLKYSPRSDGKTVFATPGSGTPYRIPAVGQTKNGDLIFVVDYRYSKADIGAGTKLDLRYRKKYASDGHWGEIKTLAAYIESPFCAFGDPCIVCDRESDRVMVTSCCGNIGYPGGSHDNHQGWARWYSTDGGESWETTHTDISQQVVDQVDQRTNAKLAAFFIGSGKISQSKTIKVKDYYRLYCASLTTVSPDGANANKTTMNYVWYSDDFGKTWKMLGDADHNPINGGDEPKADELPDGSVLISSRTTGRIYNIWHYTDTDAGEGYWGKQMASNNGNGGTYGANCNGEILVMPVKRASDGKKTYVLLQSIPYGTDRSLVSIYWKELTDLSKYRTASELAPNNWTRYQISNTTSGYSTMCQMANGHIAFFYEENSHNSGYDMVFKELDISTITNGAYSYATISDSEKETYLSAGVDSYFGSYTDATVQALATAYKNNPTRANYEALNAELANIVPVSGIECPYVSPDPVDGEWASGTKKYTLKIKSNYYITTNSKTGDYFNTSNTVAPTSDEGYWVITGDLSHGYQIRNVSAGTGKVLGITGNEDSARAALYDEDSVPSNATARFHYNTNSYGGGTFYLYGSDNNALNVRAPYLALWNNSACFNDNGSNIVLTLVEDLPTTTQRVKYDLTDSANHHYTGQFTGQLSQAPFTGVDGMTLSNVSYTESSETGVDYNLTATVAFPFTVSNGNDGNYVYISGYRDKTDKFYWYSAGTAVKAKKAATPTETDYKKYSWALIPTFNGNDVSVMAKNVQGGQYLTSTSTTNQHASGVVTLTTAGSALHYANQGFQLSGGKYISINSSNTADEQDLGTWDSHPGTKLAFFDVEYSEVPVVPATDLSATFSNSGTAWSGVQIAVNATDKDGQNLSNVTATVTGTTNLKTVGARSGNDVIVINKNTSAMSNEPMTFTVNGLAIGSSFSEISLPFYAVNSGGSYQPVNLGIRHINVSVTVKEGDATLYTDNVNDFDIGEKCGPDVLNDLLVFTPSSTITKKTNNPLTIEFKISKGTNNAGCFMAFQSLNLATEQVEPDSPLAFNDGETYAATNSATYAEMTYTRNFKNTNWQALYIPFSLSSTEWESTLEIAEIHNFIEYDDDEDGTFDRTYLVVQRKNTGATQPNTPYLVRAKATGTVTLNLTGKTLYPAEINSVDCGSVKNDYTFTGTYTPITTMYANGYYALSGGALNAANSPSVTLGAQRWYMEITPRSSHASVKPQRISILIDGEEEMEGIEAPSTFSKEESPAAYDLTGRSVKSAVKGINIKNGKKIIR